jgi:hypothetical protein
MPTDEQIKEAAETISDSGDSLLIGGVNDMLEKNMTRTACAFLKHAASRRYKRGLISSREKNKAFRLLRK